MKKKVRKKKESKKEKVMYIHSFGTALLIFHTTSSSGTFHTSSISMPPLSHVALYHLYILLKTLLDFQWIVTGMYMAVI